MEASMDENELVLRAVAHDKLAVSQLISIFEDQRPSAAALRSRVLAQLEQRQRASSVVLGITGTPGSGKSSLLARLVPTLLATREQMHVAVLAVDPSSTISGGALLGDRTRMQLAVNEERLFFRSQASATELGGLGPWSFSVCRLLAQLFDCVLVETVGIGQSEADIRRLADRTYLVLAPLGGDEIQFLKAGIMEIPDVFILNKCDDPSALRAYHQLRASLWLARPFDSQDLPLYRTSAKQGTGITELSAEMLGIVDEGSQIDRSTRDAFMLERWVRDEWGRMGLRLLDETLGGARKYLRECAGLEQAQARFTQHAESGHR
jgi:LAO/AO transport system kinase